MSDTNQLRQAVALMLDVMPNSPIFSAAQVNDLIVEMEGSAANDSRRGERNLATGVLHCAKCGLHATLIGKAFAQAKEDGCPNGCGPLWPLTWEQHVQKLEAHIEEGTKAR
jgi:hypothetical protein